MNRCVKSANQIKGHTFKAEVINLIGQFFCHTCTAKILRQVKFQISPNYTNVIMTLRGEGVWGKEVE